MQENTILEAIERYIHGEMLPEERVYFENLRKNDPTIDQMVVEHTIFLSQLDKFRETREFKSSLEQVHSDLIRAGEIKEQEPAKIAVLWKKYKRVIGVAASIAGITALAISGLISYLSPKVNNAGMDLLNRRLDHTENALHAVDVKVDHIKAADRQAVADDFKSGGTGFLIDGKGYLVTNWHVIQNATRLAVQNATGSYSVRVVYQNPGADLAFLKIEDSSYKPYGPLPYSIGKGRPDLGEELFTLGYPKNEIVYNKAYMSAETGFQGDTSNYQIAVAGSVLHGNSGSPVLNHDGEVVGVVRSTQDDAHGLAFTILSKNIYRAMDEIRSDSSLLKADSALNRLHMPGISSIRGMDRVQQIKKIEDCIFIVKSNQ